jgi:hypothetical protein
MKGNVKMIENYSVNALERVKLAVPARVVCENPDSMFNYFAWPTVARLPDGRLALYASGMRTRHVCPFGKVTVCYSEDEGKTWTKPEILINTPLDDRDAGVAVSGNRVCVTSFNNTVAFQRSIAERDADEMTEAQRKAVFEQIDSVDAESAEREYLGSLYAISEDGGKTWTTPTPLLEDGYGDGCPAHIFRHSSGTLISAYSYRREPFGIKAMISTDGGESWDTGDYRIYTNSVSPDLGYPSTVEMSDGTLLTVFYARPNASSPCVIMQQRWALED